ncbi:GAP family protein [Arthrobacter sp. ATA002]|uniref:GAP family protein n=1 Tax=Arthrobacter sp. ATA002 TaxID=2991715 RepID=UPI0022A76F97|nr:GAP family protein [Arthrobacter sp. ATA002]WAP52178.1 GAP family protein [Arthrobacter sp. ATA002]
MDPAHFGALAVLALVDSTSFGTLLIPVWLLLAPGRLRPGRILLFLATVAVFYFAAGLAILFGAELVVENFGGVFESRGFSVFLLIAGAALVAWSFQLEAKAKQEKAARAQVQVPAAPDRPDAAGSGRPGAPGPAASSASAASSSTSTTGPAGPGRLSRWRLKAVGTGPGRGGTAALVGLALAAATLELATMLPYLGAIGLISASAMTWPLPGVVLAVYCTLMVAPALILLAARITAAGRMEPLLKRLDAFLTRTSTNTLSWVTGILGVILIVNTAGPALGG